jgi:hypothetical protein
MRSVLSAVGVAVIFVLIGCYTFGGVAGSGVAKSEARSVKDFTAIHFSGVGKVTIEQTGQESLSITADDNLLPLLESRVSDGTLHLRVKEDNSISPKTPIEFKVGVKDLSKVSLSGAGDIEIKQLKTGRLEVTISGVGNATISGSADKLKVTVSGTGNFNREKFQSKHATVNCSGVGNAVVNAADSLDANVSGVGSVEYLGKPDVKQSVSGIGSVKKR